MKPQDFIAKGMSPNTAVAAALAYEQIAAARLLAGSNFTEASYNDPLVVAIAQIIATNAMACALEQAPCRT